MGPGGNVPPQQIAGAILVHPRGDAPQRAFSGRQVVAGRWFPGLRDVGGGQHPVQEMIADVLAGGGMPGRVTQAKELTDIVSGAVGVADQG